MARKTTARTVAEASQAHGYYSVSGYRPGGPQHPEPGKPTPSRVSRVRQFEGPRGLSTRAALILKYVAFFLEVLILSAFTQRITMEVSNASGSGKWMLFSIMFILVAGALGTMKNPNERGNLVKEARHYALGIVGRPGTALAIVMWAAHSYLVDKATTDAFAGLMTNALPLLYFAWVVIPALIFVKMAFGLGGLNRSNEENQTLVERLTRQDGLMR